ncbi:hypothetical protein T07_4754, partial [Trichinella nelsoni]
LLHQLVMTPLVTPNYVAGRPSSRPPREFVDFCEKLPETF